MAACLVFTILLSAAAFAQDLQEDWKPVALPNASGLSLYDIQFFDEMSGVISGWDGSKLRVTYGTTDGGTTWARSGANGNAFVHTAFVDAETGVGYGYDNDCKCAYVGRTTDGGATWSPQTFPDMTAAHGIKRIDENTIYLTGSSQGYTKPITMLSTDRGETWNEIGKTLPPVGFSIRQVLGPNEWLGSSGGTLYKSSDGGKNWQGFPITGIDGNGRAQSIHFISETTGFAAGGGNGPTPVIYRTTDGGSTWINAYTSSSYPYEMNLVYFSSPELGYAVAGDDNVVYTTDGGTKWESSSIPATNGINAMAVAGDLLYAVGDKGTVLTRSAELPKKDPPKVVTDSFSINFGPTLIGQKRTKTIDLENGGGQPLTVTDIFLEPGTKFAGFRITSAPDLPITYDPGFSVRVEVEFAPTKTGDLASVLIVASNDPNLPEFTLPLIGIGTDELTSTDDPLRIKDASLVVQPNPVRRNGTVTATLPSETSGTVEIFDLLGRHITTLHSGRFLPGRNRFDIERDDLEPGLYFCTLKTESGERTTTILVE